jgi:hypothetical protein
MKSAPEKEVQDEVTDETDIQENAPEEGDSEPEESVRNYSPSKFSALLSKKFLILLIILIVGATTIYFTLFHSKDQKPAAKNPLPEIAKAPIAPPTPPAPPQNIFSTSTEPLNGSNWKELDIAGKFKVSFPGTAEHETGNLETANKGEILKLDSYYVTIEDANNYIVFFANSLTFPPSFSGNDDALLQQTLQNISHTDENAKITSQNPSTYNGHKAMDFLLDVNGVWLKGKIIANGKTALIMAEAYFEKNYNENDYNKFVNSLVISGIVN